MTSNARSNAFSEAKHYEFVPLTPLEESFEDDATSSVMHATNESTAPPLSIVSDDLDISSTIPSDHPTLSSRDGNKTTTDMTTTHTHDHPPLTLPSLVDPLLRNKYSRYLNGSFDSTLGYTTTTDATSDTGSVDHVVGHPLAVRTQYVTHRESRAVLKGTLRSTELDVLWRQFLASPLYTDWVKCKRSPDPNQQLGNKPEMCYCEELKQLECKNRCCTKLPTNPQVLHHNEITCTNTDTTTLSGEKVNIAIQTSPSLLGPVSSHSSDTLLADCPCVSSHVIRGSPPSSNSSDQESCDLTGTCEQPASLTTLSLQEACCLFKRDFISNCRSRQKMIHHTRKQREEELIAHRHQAALADLVKEYNSPLKNDNSMPILAVGPRISGVPRPKMTSKEMHQQTKRRWKTLPEVQQRQEQVRKKAAAAINRMNMKLYQQKVLHNLRKKWN